MRKFYKGNEHTRHMNGKLMIAYSFMGIFFNIVVRYIKGLGPVPDVDERSEEHTSELQSR